MLYAFQLETGIVFDTKSVLLSLSGLFLGMIPTVIAMVMAAIYRFSLGGTGIWTGIVVILATGRTLSDFIGKREEEVWPYQLYMPMILESLNTG